MERSCSLLLRLVRGGAEFNDQLKKYIKKLQSYIAIISGGFNAQIGEFIIILLIHHKNFYGNLKFNKKSYLK
jgi:hypothetical protein